MSLESRSVDYWRDYFSTAKADLLDVLENAILVAVLDYPAELLKRRDRIAEMIYTHTTSSQCTGCCKAKLAASVERDGALVVSGTERSGTGASRRDNGGMNVSTRRKLDGDNSRSKRCKVECSRSVNDEKNRSNAVEEMNVNNSSKGKEVVDINKAGQEMEIGTVYCSKDMVDLYDEIEYQDFVLKDICSIRKVLRNSKLQSASSLVESLRRLQLMRLCMDYIKATSMEKFVSPLCMHKSEEVRGLAQAVVSEWRAMKDESVKSKEPIAAPSTSVTPYDSWDGEGLPCPPLEDYVLPARPVDLTDKKFFNGLDEEGTPRNTGTDLKIQQAPTETSKLVKNSQQAGGVRLKNRSRRTPIPPNNQAQTRSERRLRGETPKILSGNQEQTKARGQKRSRRLAIVLLDNKAESQTKCEKRSGNETTLTNNEVQTETITEAGGRRLKKRKHTHPERQQRTPIATNSSQRAPVNPSSQRAPVDPSSQRAPKNRQVDVKPVKTSCAADSKPERCLNLNVEQKMNNSTKATPAVRPTQIKIKLSERKREAAKRKAPISREQDQIKLSEEKCELAKRKVPDSRKQDQIKLPEEKCELVKRKVREQDHIKLPEEKCEPPKRKVPNSREQDQIKLPEEKCEAAKKKVPDSCKQEQIKSPEEKCEAANSKVQDSCEQAPEEKKLCTERVLNSRDIRKERLESRDPRVRTGFKDRSRGLIAKQQEST